MSHRMSALWNLVPHLTVPSSYGPPQPASDNTPAPLGWGRKEEGRTERTALLPARGRPAGDQYAWCRGTETGWPGFRCARPAATLQAWVCTPTAGTGRLAASLRRGQVRYCTRGYKAITFLFYYSLINQSSSIKRNGPSVTPRKSFHKKSRTDSCFFPPF